MLTHIGNVMMAYATLYVSIKTIFNHTKEEAIMISSLY
jgi:hypothetical protein